MSFFNCGDAKRARQRSVSFLSSLSFGARSLLCRSRRRKPSVSGESFPIRQLSQPLWLEVQPRPEAPAALTGGEAGTVGTQHKHTRAGTPQESR